MKRTENLSKQRSSNIELYRVVVMLLIVAHHYVVNSGLTYPGGPVYEDLLSWRSQFLLLFGAFGKTGINCFVLISGYFMCTSKITAKKFVKLILECEFYAVICYAVFLLCGYETVSVSRIFLLLWPFNDVSTSFTSCYLLFFLFIPFLNTLIRNLNEKQHIALICLLLMTYSGLGIVPWIQVNMNYVSWFAVVYLMAAYIRLYPKKIFEKTKLWGWVTVVSVTLSILSVVAGSWTKNHYDAFGPYFLLTDSHKILAVTNSVASFLFFKNLKMKNSGFINALGASTFGVLLIHANSDAMRVWLWQDMLNNVGMYPSKWLVIHAGFSVVIVFAVCTLLDYLRIRFLEVPLFRIWDKYWNRFLTRYQIDERKITKMLRIEEDKL